MVARLFKSIAEDDIDRAFTQDEIDTFYGVDNITDLELLEAATEETEVAAGIGQDTEQ